MNPTLEQLETKLSTVLQGLDSVQTQLRLTPDSACWTIQQIIEHLLMTYASTTAAFESRLAKGTPTLSRPSPSHRARQFVVITLGLMPGRRTALCLRTRSTSYASFGRTVDPEGQMIPLFGSEGKRAQRPSDDQR